MPHSEGVEAPVPLACGASAAARADRSAAAAAAAAAAALGPVGPAESRAAGAAESSWIVRSLLDCRDPGVMLCATEAVVDAG